LINIYIGEPMVT